MLSGCLLVAKNLKQVSKTHPKLKLAKSLSLTNENCCHFISLLNYTGNKLKEYILIFFFSCFYDYRYKFLIAFLRIKFHTIEKFSKIQPPLLGQALRLN